MENNSPDALPMTACKTSASHVSPEGIVRYWSDINKPSVFVESSMDLGGKSCHAMFYVKVKLYVDSYDSHEQCGFSLF